MRRLERNPRVVHQAMGATGQSVLLDLDTGAYFELNAIGAMVWDMLEEPRTHLELARLLRDEVVDAPPELEVDVADFIDRLRERQLIVEES